MNRSEVHALATQLITAMGAFDAEGFGARLHDAIEVEHNHDSRPDGLPAQVIGASVPIGHAIKADPLGSVILTATERAADARMLWRGDEHHEATRLTLVHLANAVNAMQAAVLTMQRLDALRVNDRGQSTEAGCRALARIGAWEQIYRRATVSGDVWPLGVWAYKFLLRTERIPSMDECKAHVNGQRVMVKV